MESFDVFAKHKYDVVKIRVKPKRIFTYQYLWGLIVLEDIEISSQIQPLLAFRLIKESKLIFCPCHFSYESDESKKKLGYMLIIRNEMQ